MTNGDKIRAMTDDDLATWLHNIETFTDHMDDPMISICNIENDNITEIYDSYGDLLEWLQQEVEG